MNVAAFNAGSSSLKVRVGRPGEPALFQGVADGFGGASSKLEVKDETGQVVARAAPRSLAEAAEAVLRFLRSEGIALGAIGHRFVHGGPALQAHCRIDDGVRAALQSASVFAPLHNPPALNVLGLAEKAYAGLPQVACLDTAFHAKLPLVARRLPLPGDKLKNGLRRYGFHGLSCESIVHQLHEVPPRLVIAHLGGGASVTAVRDGASIDTTMGLTPTGGLVMETRCGDMDPGVIFYLLRQGETVDSLEAVLNQKSGMAGVSGRGGDLRDIEAENDSASGLALRMFALSAAKGIAGMVAALGGIDLLVLTGGIGEHDSTMRDAILEKLFWVGEFKTAVLPAQEEDVIQRHTAALAG